jgi:hypothetical protein
MICDKVKDITAWLKKDVDNFLQCGEFFRNVLGADARERLTDNIAEHIACTQEFIREQAIANFASANVNYGQMIHDKVKDITAGLKKSCRSSAAIASLNCSDSQYLPLLSILVQALSQSADISVGALGTCLLSFNQLVLQHEANRQLFAITVGLHTCQHGRWVAAAIH